MADIYQSFLRSPSVASLAPNASLHYITTTTSIHEPEAIIKHLQAQAKQVEKRSENVLSCMESSNGVCLETETTFKFVRSGGAILPQMDDNLLADMEAVCAMIHVVQLDANRKISQIRLYWDQATVLKQVEAIGKSGRNWPIRSGQEQSRLISQSTKASGQSQATSGVSQTSTNAPTSNEQSQSGKSANDFHTRLFATGGEEQRSAPNDPSFAPRESAKPQAREWNELFAGEGKNVDRSPSPAGIRSPDQPILKSGAGKNFQENRLFVDAAPDARGRSPDGKRVDPTKFDHFEFGNGEDAPDNRSTSRNNSNQVSKLGFENFSTPEKLAPRPNFEQERHFGYGIDEDDPPSPPKRNIVHAPRPDADPHFRITDQNTPVAAEKQRPLSNVTNMAADRRREDMDSHSNIGQYTDPKKPAGHQARSDQTSSWSFQDMAEATPAKTQKIYKTAGDGMGGKANSRFWEIGGDEEEPEQYGGKGGVKQVYKTAGNGMGGRKGYGLSWSIGQDEDES